MTGDGKDMPVRDGTRLGQNKDVAADNGDDIPAQDNHSMAQVAAHKACSRLQEY